MAKNMSGHGTYVFKYIQMLIHMYIYFHTLHPLMRLLVIHIVEGTCHRIHLHTLQAAVMLPQKGAKLLQQTTLQVAIGRPSTTMSSVMPPLLRLQLRKCRNAHTHTHT